MQALKDLKLGGRQGVEAVLALRHTLPDSLSLAIPLYCLHIIVFLKSGKVFGPWYLQLTEMYSQAAELWTASFTDISALLKWT